ncbi:DUF3099 domain-containing protein [Arthrobacter sp. GMC3]|uniref:DUF3099 domain-containing protein n=1 Tax=Arthrobacter sp. GMC3 TaxID=2058894 RepID=UPI000CE34843|nr:DUF3099 domain-containing protein [Arthrobacter sp. GMC3]
MTDHTATPPTGAGRRKPYRRVAAVPQVQSVTNAAEAHSDEMHSRMVKYATTMGIRMVCLVLIFVFDGWFKLIPIAGAVLLPWVAVVIANAGADTNHITTTDLLDQAPLYELPEASPVMDDDADVSSVILTGEFVIEDDAPLAGGPDDGEDDPVPPQGQNKSGDYQP